MPLDDDDSVDREARTPNQAGSFVDFLRRSRSCSVRFEQIALILEKRMYAIEGPEGSRRMREYASELASMALRFENWPKMHPETVALERPMLVSRLMDLQIICSKIALRTPGLPPTALPPGR